jgi:hypothetical protein
MNSQETLFTKVLLNTFAFFVMLASAFYHQVNAVKLRIRHSKRTKGLSR